MNITLLKSTVRSACFEIDCGRKYIYKSPSKYNVYINGNFYTKCDTNVFSVYGLRPGMSYNIKVKFKDESSLSCDFVTPNERICLDVTRFGCVGDGKTDCTNAFQAAINACGEKGGTVYVKKGIYLTYPLFLKSNILLYLEDGAVLLGGTDRNKYPILPGMITNENDTQEDSFGTWEGNPLDSYASLLTTIDATNVSIVGEGTIDANAQNSDWWQNHLVRRGAWRPRTVFAVRAKDFTIMGVTVKNSPAWTIHPYYCKNVDVLAVKIQNPPDTPNTDGCNPESSENVRVIGTDISVGDDCIAIKSGKYYMSKYHSKPSKNILVRNCLLRRGHGAVVVGSEISSGVCGINVELCLMQDTDRGLRIKTRRGRGDKSIVDDVNFSDISMEHVLTPFVVNMFYNCDPDGHTKMVWDKESRAVDELTPSVKKIKCRNIKCSDAQYAGIFLYGLPESPIESFDVENVEISFADHDGKGMPDMMDDLEPVNSLAMFATNVNKLRIHNVNFSKYDGEMLRLDNVKEKDIVVQEVSHD